VRIACRREISETAQAYLSDGFSYRRASGIPAKELKDVESRIESGLKNPTSDKIRP